MGDRVTPSPGVAAAPADPSTRRDAMRLALIVAQLAAVLALVRVFNIEGPAFFNVCALAVAGFLVHLCLPERQRLPWFAALSVLSVFVAVGVPAASTVLVLGAVLIATCHLPAGWGLRVGLLFAAGAGLAIVRLWAGHDGLFATALPVLASMFMFRLALYLHALRQGEVSFSPPLAVAYFFMVPNASFALFPVVDYRRFVQSRSAADALTTYEIGVRWIGRGLTHLLLYRLVFFDLAPRELFVYDLGDLVRHVLSVVLLYLKVSGQFHLIVGLLHLFGFRLPETHHLYLLAPSLPEFWRRINIYWKDFMAKMVYFPVVASLGGASLTRRVLLGSSAVFAASWLLHSYQVFWIEGRPLLSWIDASFWAIFAALTLLSLLRARNRSEPSRGWSASRAAGTLRTFAIVAVLWSFWNAESWGSWLHMWTQARHATAAEWLWLGAIVLAGSVVAGFSWPRRSAERNWRAGESLAWARLAAMLVASAFVGWGAHRQLPAEASEIVLHLQGRGLAAHQELLDVPGYYERLTRREPPPADPPAAGDPAAPLPAGAEPLFVAGPDFLGGRLGRSVRTAVDGKLTTTNRLGLRDREYDVARPPGTVRIALMGASDIMGAGLADDETVDARLEPRLDAWSRRRGLSTEVLNLGYGGWSITQRAVAIPTLAGPLTPDLILFVVYHYELPLLPQGVAGALAADVAIPEPVLADAVRTARLTSDMTPRTMLAHLRPFEPQILAAGVRRAAAEADRLGVPLLLVAIQLPGAPGAGNLPMLQRLAAQDGMPMIDCSRIWEGQHRLEVSISEQDPHPNARGAMLIADCLYDRLVALPLLDELVRATPIPGSPER